MDRLNSYITWLEGPPKGRAFEKNYMNHLLLPKTRTVVGLSTEPMKCDPQCRFFTCKQRALVRRGKESYCRWVDDTCDVKTCAYASCMKFILLPDGFCGMTVKRRTRDELEVPPEEEDMGIKPKKKLDII